MKKILLTLIVVLICGCTAVEEKPPLMPMIENVITEKRAIFEDVVKENIIYNPYENSISFDNISAIDEAYKEFILSVAQTEIPGYKSTMSEKAYIGYSQLKGVQPSVFSGAFRAQALDRNTNAWLIKNTKTYNERVLKYHDQLTKNKIEDVDEYARFYANHGWVVVKNKAIENNKASNDIQVPLELYVYINLMDLSQFTGIKRVYNIDDHEDYGPDFEESWTSEFIHIEKVDDLNNIDLETVKKLRELFDLGILTEEEYLEKKNKILEK